MTFRAFKKRTLEDACSNAEVTLVERCSAGGEIAN